MNYKEISIDLARQAPVSFFDLNDFFSGSSLPDKRERLLTQFGITEDKLEREIQFNPDVNILYRGMIRFMEEELAMNNYTSGNQLHKAAKLLTRGMMFRNEAYSNLIKKEFSDKIRLSMHPSVNNGAKFSFQLIPGDAKHSAWHSALFIDRNGGFHTMHKKDAEAAGLQLMYKNSKPYYYVNS